MRDGAISKNSRLQCLKNLLQRAHYQHYEQRMLARILAEYQGKCVLDIGCGHGKYLEMLAGAGCTATGVDVNAEHVTALRGKGFDAYTPEGFLAAGGGQRYDALLMAHVIEHMNPTDLLACMDSYLPLLKDDGRLIVVTPVLGERFYYDVTHVRPYYPQSIRMLFGGISTPASVTSQHRMVLEDIHFFRDSWRLRTCRAFYPVPDNGIRRHAIGFINHILAAAHVASGGRAGALASWLGIYRKA